MVNELFHLSKTVCGELTAPLAVCLQFVICNCYRHRHDLQMVHLEHYNIGETMASSLLHDTRWRYL